MAPMAASMSWRTTATDRLSRVCRGPARNLDDRSPVEHHQGAVFGDQQVAGMRIGRAGTRPSSFMRRYTEESLSISRLTEGRPRRTRSPRRSMRVPCMYCIASTRRVVKSSKTRGALTARSPAKARWKRRMLSASTRKSISSRTFTENSRITLARARMRWLGKRTFSQKTIRNAVSTSRATRCSTPGRSTLTAISLPSSRARCTCPRLAAAMGSRSKLSKRSASFPSSSLSITLTISSGRIGRHLVPERAHGAQIGLGEDIGTCGEHLRQLDEGRPQRGDRLDEAGGPPLVMAGFTERRTADHDPTPAVAGEGDQERLKTKEDPCETCDAPHDGVMTSSFFAVRRWDAQSWEPVPASSTPKPPAGSRCALRRSGRRSLPHHAASRDAPAQSLTPRMV